MSKKETELLKGESKQRKTDIHVGPPPLVSKPLYDVGTYDVPYMRGAHVIVEWCGLS